MSWTKTRRDDRISPCALSKKTKVQDVRGVSDIEETTERIQETDLLKSPRKSAEESLWLLNPGRIS